ncbi:hypothetical protein [Pedobacter sp. Leaf170]|uniref:hypothetical protein n=1 Tax=Pedobacter sp. Leaf170 TaxID=2876558 RepID=UPI001E4930F5|nr:hypothetical protein [Pedobacter sp. Leaf170]
MITENEDSQQANNLINIITFNVRATKTVTDDGIIPWINIARANEEILNLVDADELVIAEKEVSISIDYPFENPETFSLISPIGFTRTQLLIAIREKFITFAKAQNIEIDALDLVSLDVYKTDSGSIEITLDIDL